MENFGTRVIFSSKAVIMLVQEELEFRDKNFQILTPLSEKRNWCSIWK